MLRFRVAPPSSWYGRVAIGLVSSGVATLVRLAIDPVLGDEAAYVLFVAAVLFATWLGRRLAGAVAGVCSAVAADYFFVPPRHTLLPIYVQDAAADLVFISVAALIVWQVSRWRTAERALQQGEERFRSLAENLPSILLRYDRDCRIVYLSPLGERAAGAAPGTLIGKTTRAMGLSAESSDQFERAIRAVFSTGEGRDLEFDLPAADGPRTFYLKLAPELADDRTVRHVLGIATDLTERQHAEAARLESEAAYRRLFENMVEGLCVADVICDEHGAPVDFRFLDANRAFETLTRLKREAVLGRTVRQVLPGIEPAWIELFGRVALSGEPATLEDYVAPLGRYYRTVAYSPRRGKFACLFEDVTDRRMTEAALHESRERFAWVLETTGVGVWLNPLPLGQLAWDQQTRRLFFVPPGVEPTVDLFWSRLHPDDREATGMAVARAIRDRTLYQIDHRVMNPETGEIRWIRSAGRASYAPDGTPVHFDGINYDITDAKRATEALAQEVMDRQHLEQQLRQQAEVLAQANRVKDEFLATLSHELRTPLNAILGWSQMLVQGKLDGETREHALRAIDRNAQAQNLLIADVLDVSRIVSGKLHVDLRPMDILESLRAAVDVLRPAAQAKRIALHVECLPGVSVLGDPARLQQVFWNLLSNAVKFTPEGGWIGVSSRVVESHVEVCFTDTGSGIAPEFLPHVFERFRQYDSSTTRLHAGLGLGLAIVEHLVMLHGGQVTAASAGEGYGSTFTVVLPLRAAPPAEAERDRAAPVEAPRAPLSGIRVLAVDDEHDARELVRTVLGAEGAEVRTVGSVRQAFDLLAEWRPDVVLCDIGMPREDGYDMVRQLRARDAEHGGTIPAVALTAYGRPEDRARALTAGYQRHLAKPVTPAEMIAVVREVLGRS